MAAWDLVTTRKTYYYTGNVSCNLWASYFADIEWTNTDTLPYYVYTATNSMFCSGIQTRFLSVLDNAAAEICCSRLEIQAQDSLGTSSHHPVSRDTGSCTIVPIPCAGCGFLRSSPHLILYKCSIKSLIFIYFLLRNWRVTIIILSSKILFMLGLYGWKEEHTTFLVLLALQFCISSWQTYTAALSNTNTPVADTLYQAAVAEHITFYTDLLS
jgi:hypothetical protein